MRSSCLTWKDWRQDQSKYKNREENDWAWSLGCHWKRSAKKWLETYENDFWLQFETIVGDAYIGQEQIIGAKLVKKSSNKII